VNLRLPFDVLDHDSSREATDGRPRVRRARLLVGAPEGGPASRSIRLERHAGRCRARLDQLHVVRLAVLREEPHAVAHDDRVDPQIELVDEVALEQPPEQLAADMDLELTPGLRLELA
jgi:hypothetical protein